MGMLLYLVVFQSSWYSLLLFIMPMGISYSLFVAIIALVCCIGLFVQIIFSNNGRMSKSMFALTLVSLLVAIGFFLTETHYGFVNERFRAYELSYISEVIPAIMLGSYIAKNEKLIINVKKIVPVVGLILSLFSIYTAVFPDGFDNTGLIETSYGVNYQSNSYMASYAFSLMMYYVLFSDEINWPKFFRTRLARRIGIGIAVIDIFALVRSGGRGGIVFLFVMVLFYGFIMLKKGRLTKHSFISLCLATVLVPIGIFMLYSWMQKQSQSIVAVKRVLTFLNKASDPIRTATAAQGVNIFFGKPLLGHGIGSVFYEIGMYSHNIAIDLLIEVGAVGMGLFIILLYVSVQRGIKLSRTNMSNCIWFVLFLTGFVQALFSGYYLSIPSIFASIAFWLCATDIRNLQTGGRRATNES